MRVEYLINLRKRLISFESLARMIIIFEKAEANTFYNLLMNYLDNDKYKN
jgi:hypothetical protein